MTIYIIYSISILVTIILYFLVKDKQEFINKLGIITLIAGFITLLLGLLSNTVLNTLLNNFNIKKISILLFEKFLYNGIILLVIGVVEVLISKFLNKKNIEEK